MAPAKHSGAVSRKALVATTTPVIEPAPERESPGENAADALPSKGQRAERIIRDNIAWSCAAGLIPVPLFDIAAITAAQLKLVRELSELYGVPFQDHLGRNVVASLVGSVGSAAVGRGIFCSLLKAVPVVGSIGGLISVPIVAGAATYALGKVFVEHFESGGTLLDFKPEPMREFFEASFKEGQKVAREVKDKVARTTQRKQQPNTQ